MRDTAAKPAGLYVHIPFCLKKCRYCDFYSISDLSLRARFLTALIREMQMASRRALVFDTIYIGGGTPSVLETKAVGQVFDASAEFFKLASDSEITLEVNPGTVTLESLKAYRDFGVNRLNIGVQSFNENCLAFLGRIHTVSEARMSFELARRAGFDNIGLDLIYGVPGQDKANWLLDLATAVEIEPEHLSCYMLTYEPGTPLQQELKAGRISQTAEKTVAELFFTTIEFLTAHGFFHYEISNFARLSGPGHKAKTSRHNLKYWSFAPYIGLGPSAHSFIEPERYWNQRSVTKYMRQIEAGQTAMAQKERLTQEQMMMEAIFLGLRTSKGIDLVDFERRFGIDFRMAFHDTIADFENERLLKIAGTHCRLTSKGMILLDGITAAFTNQDISEIRSQRPEDRYWNSEEGRRNSEEGKRNLEEGRRNSEEGKRNPD